MKKKFLKLTLQSIQKYHPEYNAIKMDKSIVIFIIAILFHIFWEMILMLLFFNILRKTGFGLHASKSSYCLISSTSVFIILPIVAKYIIIPILIKWILCIIAVILIYLYAPADTKKHPLIYANRRKKYKYVTTCNSIILSGILLFITNETISNLILFGMYCEVLLILPITYKIFHLSYNNYKTYLKNQKAELNIL